MVVVTLVLGLLSFNSSASEVERQKLRTIMTDVEAGLNANAFAKISQHLHKDVIVTFHNAELAKGIDGVNAYVKKIFDGPAAVLKGYSTKAAVDQPAIFYDDVAVAAGYTNERYDFTDGLGIDLYSRWSATLIKQDDNWKVIALHFSNNLFDNALLSQANQSNKLFAGIGLVSGLIIGFVVVRLMRKKNAA